MEKKGMEEEILHLIDRTPLVSVDLIVSNPRGEVLLGRRVNRPARGYWFVPGGRILKNEPIETAIRRISRTELGFEISRNEARLLGAYDHIYEDNFLGVAGINTHYVALGFRYDAREGRTVRPDEQHSALKWWPVAALLEDPGVHPNTKAYF